MITMIYNQSRLQFTINYNMIYKELQLITSVYNGLRSITRWFTMIYNGLYSITMAFTINYNMIDNQLQ